MSTSLLSDKPYLTWELDLSKMDHYSDILKVMKHIKVTDYVYTFIFHNEIIKHGLSTPTDVTSEPGERIYRQAGNIEGWGSRLHGPSGKDMLDIDADYFSQTGKRLNRMGMKIIVRDQTGLQSPSVSDHKWHVKQLERKLIKEHVSQFGKLPIGNIKEEAYIDGKSFVSAKLWHDLFERNNDHA